MVVEPWSKMVSLASESSEVGLYLRMLRAQLGPEYTGSWVTKPILEPEAGLALGSGGASLEPETIGARLVPVATGAGQNLWNGLEAGCVRSGLELRSSEAGMGTRATKPGLGTRDVGTRLKPRSTEAVLDTGSVGTIPILESAVMDLDPGFTGA